MTVKEAEEYAKNMTYREAVYNALQGRAVPFKKASKIKLDELLEIADKADSEITTNAVLDEIKAEFISLYPKNYMGEPELGGASCVFSLDKVLEIIDKYKEGEDKK